MNGFADHGLDESAFGEKRGGFRENIRTFDAFRKSRLTTPRSQLNADNVASSPKITPLGEIFALLIQFIQFHR